MPEHIPFRVRAFGRWLTLTEDLHKPQQYNDFFTGFFTRHGMKFELRVKYEQNANTNLIKWEIVLLKAEPIRYISDHGSFLSIEHAIKNLENELKDDFEWLTALLGE